MLLEQDTIVAISTPPGRGGIGVVRLSGARAVAIASPMLRLRHELAAGRARFGQVLGAEGEVLDEVVATYFAAPHSYTSEDVVELAAHGAPVLLEAIVRGCLAAGARLAEPGEFTQRAFLSGRLDLTQAEAVHDLISAQTLHQARVAAAQLGGALAAAVGPVKGLLVSLIAELEAGVDFAEDDLDLLSSAEISVQLQDILAPLLVLEGSFRQGRIVREGFTLALVGAPNAGKSSLFNALLQRERAIVTVQPGTTRDPITEMLAMGGVPVQLVDTAGLREAPEGEAEAMGIARSREAMAEADLVLVVSDGVFEAGLLAGLRGRPYLLVRSKRDLGERTGNGQRRSFDCAQDGSDLGGAGEDKKKDGQRQETMQISFGNDKQIATSARTGEGLEELRAAILECIGLTSADSAMVTNLRQHTVIAETVAALRQAAVAVSASMPHELILLDLYAALSSLDALTGATSQEDVLALIFSRFCIGK